MDPGPQAPGFGVRPHSLTPISPVAQEWDAHTFSRHPAHYPIAMAMHSSSSTLGPGELIMGDSSLLWWLVSRRFGGSLWREQDADRRCSSTLTRLWGKHSVLLLLRGCLDIKSLSTCAKMLLLLKSVVQLYRDTERPDRRGISHYIQLSVGFCT